MDLAEKLKLLRTLEGSLRGVDRPLAKSEVVRLMKQELGVGISEAYLSQLESGKRPHMTEKSRDLIARFFKVHPGYLVTDPQGFRTELASMAHMETRMDDWLRAGAFTFLRSDPEAARAMQSLADSADTRTLVLVAARLSECPDLFRKLAEGLGVVTSLENEEGGK